MKAEGAMFSKPFRLAPSSLHVSLTVRGLRLLLQQVLHAKQRTQRILPKRSANAEKQDHQCPPDQSLQVCAPAGPPFIASHLTPGGLTVDRFSILQDWLGILIKLHAALFDHLVFFDQYSAHSIANLRLAADAGNP